MRAQHPDAAGRARPQTSWRWRLMAGVVAALVVVGGVVSIASASSGRGGGAAGRTLRFRTTLVSSAVNDAGHGGVANVSALRFSVQRRDGSAAGEAWISCVVMVANEQLCHGAFVLANGQIEAQVATPMTAATFTAAITGGTGAFEGAKGQIDNVVVAPGVIDRTFHLLPRHD